MARDGRHRGRSQRRRFLDSLRTANGCLVDLLALAGRGRHVTLSARSSLFAVSVQVRGPSPACGWDWRPFRRSLCVHRRSVIRVGDARGSRTHAGAGRCPCWRGWTVSGATCSRRCTIATDAGVSWRVPRVGDPAEILESWRPLLAERRLDVVGDGVGATRLTARAGCSDGPTTALLGDPPPLAPVIARIAYAAPRNQGISPHAVQPLYVRRPDAVDRSRSEAPETGLKQALWRVIPCGCRVPPCGSSLPENGSPSQEGT